MPYATVEVNPEVFMEHKGVKVYHVYTNNSWDDGPEERLYTLSIDGEPGYNDFFINDLPGWSEEEEDRIAHTKTSSRAVSHLLDEYYKKLIAAALDSGELKVPA